MIYISKIVLSRDNFKRLLALLPTCISSVMLVNAIFCLPDYGFDPTEAAVPFEMFVSKGWKVSIATEHGQEA